MAWKVVEWSRIKDPKIIVRCNSKWGARMYKFFNYDVFFFANPPHTCWSIEEDV